MALTLPAIDRGLAQPEQTKNTGEETAERRRQALQDGGFQVIF